MRTLLAVCAVALTGVILPSGVGAAGTAPAAQLPDFWTGVWPAELMPDETPLGTLTFREIRYEEGMATVGKIFGGKVFGGCPTNGETRFFRGRYVEGGDLIGCTIGPNADRLIGRFNGREDFMSGSFDVSIVEHDPHREFEGKYFEDQGITTDWCGDFLAPQALTETPKPGVSPDVAAPRVKMLGWSGGAGVKVPLRASVADNSPTASTVTFTVRRSGRIVKTATSSARPGAVALASWTAPKSLRGTFTVCATAVDAAGNESARSCATIRLR